MVAARRPPRTIKFRPHVPLLAEITGTLSYLLPNVDELIETSWRHYWQVLRVLAGGLLALAILAGTVPPSKALADTAAPAVLRVVMEDNYPPYIMRKANGALAGYLVDAWQLWQQKTGVRVEIMAREWAEAEQIMAAGQADVIDTVSPTPQRRATLDFGQPYVNLPINIYTDAKLTGIDGPDALSGLRIGVEEGNPCEAILIERGLGDLAVFPNYDALLQAFLDHKVHLFCMDELAANYLVARAHAEAEVRQSFTLHTSEFRRAVHKGDTATLALVERGFAAISATEAQALHDKWFGQSLTHPLQRSLLYGLAAAVLLIALLAGMAMFLRRRVAERTATLRAIERQLRATLDALPDLMFEMDLDGRYLDYHSPRSDLLAAPPTVFLGTTLSEVLPPDVAETGLAALREANASGYSHGRQIELDLAGGKHWFELSVARKAADAGAKPTFVVLSRDITVRKTAEAKLTRLSNLYAALSQCNQAIVRCVNETELFSVLCRDVVNFGGMKLAWIGAMEEAAETLKPIAAFGAGIEYLAGLEISLSAEVPTGHGPTGTALREDRPVWCQDFQHDPATAPWHERAARFGWGASAALPLHRGGVVMGALNLYASEVGIFDEAVQNLLIEMAMDIDFAIDNFEREAQRQRTEAALRDSEERYRKAFQTSPDAVNINRLTDGLYLEANPGFERMSGWRHDEVVGKTSAEIHIWRHPEDRQRLVQNLLREGHCDNFEVEFIIKDGTVRLGSMSARLVHIKGESCILSITRDITEQRRAEERIQNLAYFDQLTGLPNRTYLTERFHYALSLSQRSGEPLAVMFLDLDHFKDINDSLGHSVGDRLLVEMAARIKDSLREEDTLSRLGGDEFILVLPGTGADGAAKTASRLIDAVARPCRIGPHELNTTISIGISVYPDDGNDFETLSKNADAAMYRVKRSGRNAFRFFTQEMQEHSARILTLVNALYRAAARGELLLQYQPQLSLQNDRLVGVEALLRWQHPELGLILPGEFIPLAESSGQIVEIGAWVLHAAARQLRHWLDAGLPAMTMAVNLSAVQFHHPNLPDMVSRILDEVGLAHEYLELELTEAVAMDDPQAAIAMMDRLHERGIRMSIDDFGTGYSSLSYLKKFKVNKLKIDQSFVRDVTDDPEDKAIVAAIINMAGSLGMRTIAEGVETAAQVALLRAQGCVEAQGYYFSKPLPAEQFESFVRQMALRGATVNGKGNTHV